MRNIVLLACLLPIQLWADSIQLIQLHNRPAEEIIPLIQPMLRGDEAISGQGDQLILRASPSTQNQVRQLLNDLDRAPRTLIISVRSSTEDLRSGEHAQGRIVVGPDGTMIQGSAGAREYSTGRNGTQRIRVLEGQPARLRVGEDTAITEPALVPYPGGVAVVPSTRIQSTGRWISVIPRLQGQQVLLDIAPEEAFADPRHPRTLDVQQISTQVIAPLGEWVPLGGVNSSEQRSSGWSASTRERTSHVWVKVEPGY